MEEKRDQETTEKKGGSDPAFSFSFGTPPADNSIVPGANFSSGAFSSIESSTASVHSTPVFAFGAPAVAKPPISMNAAAGNTN